MKMSTVKVLALLLALTILGSCEGGSMGCSGCAGCEMEPIPGDFPLDKRVENAVQVHVTQNAIDFLESNYEPLIENFFPDGLFFEVPASTQDIGGIGTIDICPGGGCGVNLQVLNMAITPVPPKSLRAVIQVGVALYDLPLSIQPGLLCLCWEDCDCSVDFNTADSGRPYNSFETTLVFDIDTTTGYTKLAMQGSGIVDEIENDDLNITNSNFCGLAVCNIANLGFIKDLIIGQLTSSLSESLEGPFNEGMCRACGESGCPAGSTCDGTTPEDTCIYGDGTCVPIILGMQGRMDVGGLLSAFSPGTQATVDLLAAAGGYAETSVDPEAIDLGLFGGLEPAPASDCARKAPTPCVTDTDCASGYTCRELTAVPNWLLPCQRCASGCPAGSTPRDEKPCVPNPEDPLEEYDPSQPCMREDDTCVPILYCQDAAGQVQTFTPPGSQVVPVAEILKTDQLTHCVYCETDENCTPPYTCDMYSVCTMEDEPGSCQTATDPVMMVIGLSETYLRRALLGAASSGALCLEIPPGTIPQLNSQLLVAALPPLENLVWDTAPVALVLRPTVSSFSVARPEFDAMDSPDIEVSDKPLLNVILRDVSIDFYIWTQETYSKFLTATFDLALGVDLLVRGGTITPIIRSPEVNDVRAYNNDLLQMEDEALRNTIKGLIELAMGFVPALDPIAVPEIEMFMLDLPDGAATHVQESGEDFLALYANLAVAPAEPPPPSPFPAEVETSLKLVESFNPKIDLSIGTAAMFSECDGRPTFVVAMSAVSPSEQDHCMEYRWRLNGGPWSRWSKNDTERIESYQFVFQGRHFLEVQARVWGAAETEDATPASLELVVDGIPPQIAAELKHDRTLAVSVSDLVSPPDRIAVEVRRTYHDGSSSGWQAADGDGEISIVDPRLMSVDIRAMDEVGNTSTETFEIRGRLPAPDPDASGCMDCAAAGSRSDGGLGAVLLILGLAGAVIVARMRRRTRRFFRGLLPVLVAGLLAGNAACSCDGDGNGEPGPCEDNQGPECCLTNEDCGENIFCCTVNHVCMELPTPLASPPAPDSVEGLYNEACDPGFFCEDLPQFTIGATEEEGCSFDWSCCQERSPLAEGRLGTYLGMDVRQAGADTILWISGYSAGTSSVGLYGDLVAGRWDPSTGEIGWEILDGVPEDGFITNSTDGWRGGIGEEGDDVGLYTSLILDESGNPMVSYYDLTNGALKFIRHDGSSWLEPEVVDDAEGTDAGRYSEIVRLPSQAPVILYRAVTWAAMDHPGAVGYQVVHLATHLRSATRSGTTWQVSTVVSEPDAPCWAGGCPEGYVCRADDRLCWPPASEDDHAECDGCAGTQACLSEIDDSGAATGVFGCQDILTLTDVPEGIAVWISAALNPAGDIEAVYYDRTGGNLLHLAQQGGLWQTPVILDGDEENPDPALHGDRGWYPSLAVDGSGNRHIVYVDGIAEVFDYMMVDAAGTVTLRELIDDGVDTANADKDLVGDNASVAVDSAGRVRVVYQNSSDGILMMALRDTDGTWTLTPVTDADAGFMGYYALQRMVGDTSYVAQFFMNFESPPTGTGVGVLACTVDGSGLVTCD
jgi:hypothetical protein